MKFDVSLELQIENSTKYKQQELCWQLKTPYRITDQFCYRVSKYKADLQ